MTRTSLMKTAAALCSVFGMSAAAEVVTNDMANASWGYVISGLGAGGDESACVFTNTTEQMSWSVPSGVSSVDLLVVGGGGAGGGVFASSSKDAGCGGGGAGGFNYIEQQTVVAGAELTIMVGAGGAATESASNNGGDSYVTNTVYSLGVLSGGGGSGGCFDGAYNIGPGDGSSGGGACGSAQTPGSANGLGAGFGGGTGALCGYSSPASHPVGGGGGGAGGAGSANDSRHGGAGGIGVACGITGTEIYYAGGGAAAGCDSSGGTGGNGGGGKGGKGDGNGATKCGAAGIDGLGGGGGGSAGCNETRAGGKGGNGVVIIRYAEPALDPPDIPGQITTNAIPGSVAGEVWGYRISGLGDAGDEIAYVFTNTTAQMSWSVPWGVSSVQLLIAAGGGAGGAGDTYEGTACRGGGGGGGGGLFYNSGEPVVGGAEYAIVVGVGGTTGNGGDSSFGARSIAGGGKGGIQSAGSDGGCGGGGSGIATKTGPQYGGGIGSVCYDGGCGNGYNAKSANGGGGGGAGAPGDDTDGDEKGADGGEGESCDITGCAVVYCSGGGGGSDGNEVVGLGGTGAGNGGAMSAGTDATGYGGGGGGGSGQGNAAGKGFQGIVVVRYAEPALTVIAKPVAGTLVFDYDGEVKACLESGTGYTVENGSASEAGRHTATVRPLNGYVWDNEGDHSAFSFDWEIRGPVALPVVVSGLVYNGTEQTGVAEGTAYELSGEVTATAAGTYHATATLLEGYSWIGGSTAPQQLEWTIAQAGNSWTVKPSISPSEWYDNGVPGTLTAAAAPSGVSAMISKDGGAETEFDGTFPTEPGTYVITYSATDTDNYTALETKSVTFTVLTSRSAMNKPEWGYRIVNLGAGGNEIALVFTNKSAAMSWSVPWGVSSVDLLVVGGGGAGAGKYSTTAKDAGFGGGGAGGYNYRAAQSVVGDSVCSIKVGAGGTASTSASGNGGDSFVTNVLSSIAILSGGGGAGGTLNAAGSAGASGGGGGGGYSGNSVVAKNGGSANGLGTGKAGGKSGSAKRAGGGGGGAGSAGVQPTDSTGGAGGAGLACSITGAEVYYAGGGGGGGYCANGGNGGLGGGGKGGHGEPEKVGGDDGMKAGAPGTDGLGGGGGGSAQYNAKIAGGRGGSGVVIIRYAQPETTIVAQPVPTLAFDWDGEAKTCIAAGTGYTVENATATAPGRYTATVTPVIGYVWNADGDHESYEVVWEIHGPVAVPEGVPGLVYDGGVKTGVVANAAYTLTGDVTAFNAGDYTATATLIAGCRWEGGPIEPVQVEWSIAKASNVWTTQPAVTKSSLYDWEVEGALTPGAAVTGIDSVTIAKDGGAAVPFDGTMPMETGSYVITYYPAADANYTELAPATVAFTVTSTRVAMTESSWGYRQLVNDNVDPNEVVLVFTNTAAAMSWRAPYDVSSVELLVVAGGGAGGAGSASGWGSTGGGGGGAGGCFYSAAQTVAHGRKYAISVGVGGAAANGGNSAFGEIEMVGGGKGGAMSAGAAGGSGGGGSGASLTSNGSKTYAAGGAASDSTYGYNGGQGGGEGSTKGGPCVYGAGGGGGGAGGDGTGLGWGADNGGAGGAGRNCSITGYASVYSAGGGGGADGDGATAGAAGGAGAGAGGAGTAGGDATGYGCGGGGGTGGGDVGGRGAQGVVILRFNSAKWGHEMPTAIFFE